MPPSRRTRTALRGCGVTFAAVLVLGVTAACTSHDDETGATGPGGAHTTSSAPAAAARAGASAAPSNGTGAQGSTGSRPVTPGGAENAPNPTPGPAGLLPADTEAAGPSLTGPLPATGAANGKLVAGFPKDVVPIPDGVEVVSSSVSASGTHLQIGMQASSASTPADVQGAYIAALSSAGFAISDSPALPGSTATAFTRGPDGLVITVQGRTGGGTELSLAGTLTTAG